MCFFLSRFFCRNLLQKVQSPHMPKGSFLHSKFQMSWTPSFSVNSGLQSTLRPMMGSGEHGDQRTSKVTSRTERKVRITYTEKQKRMLQDHFNNCRYPTQKDRMALASRVGVTHNDIQVCLSLFPVSDNHKIRFHIIHLSFVFLNA